MKAMFLGFTAAIVIAVGAAVVLGAVQQTTAERYAASSVRM